MDAADSTLARLNRATQDLDPPLAVIDLAAFNHNREDLAHRASGTPIRVASKSLRVRSVIADILKHPEFSGVLSFTLPEAIWLAAPTESWDGIDDVVVGYPSVDRAAIKAIASSSLLSSRITLMVDDVAQLEFIATAASGGTETIQVCIDVDSSWRPQMKGNRTSMHVGVRRSPLHDADDVVAMAREVIHRPRLSLAGLMFYEAQIAGVGDDPPGHPMKARAIRIMQARSGKEIAQRRPEIVDAVAAELARGGRSSLEFVNAGGTGSLELSSKDQSVTEVTAGSGFFGPTLFDAYRGFRPAPAAAFALPVVRRPAADIVTVLGGGYIASGPAQDSRLPRPWLPVGLALDSLEGAGEVQTPLRGAAANQLAIGDRVWFRHAKAGELAERFAEMVVIDGDNPVEVVPTYRGEGATFL